MKKIIALLLVVAVICVAVSCGKDQQDGTNASTEASTVATTAATTAYVSPTDGVDTKDYTARTLCELFLSLVEAYPDEDLEQIAARYMSDKWFVNREMDIYSEAYPDGYMPYIVGLKNEFIVPRYASVTHILPFMFPNTYVSHAFVLEEGTDADAFCKALADNADLAFNVCMISSDCYADHVGNIAFFVIK